MSSQVVDFDEALAAFDPVLGLEVHVELNTASKMFCGCSTAFGAEPNTHTCPVCLGLPGSLPVVNAKAIESAIRIGLALNCTIADWCRFARKNYFYPDMTKDFQISQYDEPIAFDGYVDLDVDGETFRIEIERAHMEEDAGKLLHLGGSTGRIGDAEYSLLDYNRAGTPLIEIVTKTIHGTGAKAPQVAKAYVSFLRDLMVSLGVSDARMEQASLRCDANVSIMPKGTTTLGLRTETKNVNSLRSVERALHHEIRRQAAVLSSGGTVQQETRHWHEDGEYTTPGRLKSDAEDYRYFPEPDLVPVAPSREWVEELRAHAARAAEPAQAAPAGRLGLHRPRTPGRGQRRSARRHRGDRRRRREPAGRPQVVADRTRPQGQRGRRRAGRAGHHPGPGGGGPGTRRRRHGQRQAGTAGHRRRARRRGHALQRSSQGATSPWSPTPVNWPQPWTGRSRPTPMSRPASATATCRRPAR